MHYYDVHVFLGHWNLRNMSPVPSVGVGEIHTPFCPTLRCDHRPALMPFLWNCLHHQGQILLSMQNTHRSFQTGPEGKWIWMDLTTNLRPCRSKNWDKWNILTFQDWIIHEVSHHKRDLLWDPHMDTWVRVCQTAICFGSLLVWCVILTLSRRKVMNKNTQHQKQDYIKYEFACQAVKFKKAHIKPRRKPVEKNCACPGQSLVIFIIRYTFI